MMIVNVSAVVVLIVGILVGVLSVWGIVVPKKLLTFVRAVMDRKFGMPAAVVARLLLGAALLVVADESRYPLAFELFGWIAIVAAVGLAMIGRERLLRFVAWFDRFSPTLIRLWLLLGIAFGGFLVYGVT